MERESKENIIAAVYRYIDASVLPIYYTFFPSRFYSSLYTYYTHSRPCGGFFLIFFFFNGKTDRRYNIILHYAVYVGTYIYVMFDVGRWTRARPLINIIL